MFNSLKAVKSGSPGLSLSAYFHECSWYGHLPRSRPLPGGQTPWCKPSLGASGQGAGEEGVALAFTGTHCSDGIHVILLGDRTTSLR